MIWDSLSETFKQKDQKEVKEKYKRIGRKHSWQRTEQVQRPYSDNVSHCQGTAGKVYMARAK